MSADPYGDLDRAYRVLRRAAELVVQRWRNVVDDEQLTPESISVLADETGIDLAGVGEAVTLLERELANRLATRPS